MDTLPTELVAQILDHIPRESWPSSRLTSRRFHAVLGRKAFEALPAFLDAETAERMLESAASQARVRLRSIWSPRCSVPDGLPVPRSFLEAMHVGVKGSSWDAAVDEIASDTASESDCSVGSSVSVDSLVDELHMDGVTEDAVRAAMFRYALYLSYKYTGGGEAPQLWVFEEKKWADKE